MDELALFWTGSEGSDDGDSKDEDEIDYPRRRVQSTTNDYSRTSPYSSNQRPKAIRPTQLNFCQPHVRNNVSESKVSGSKTPGASLSTNRNKGGRKYDRKIGMRNSFSCVNLKSQGRTPTTPEMTLVLPPEVEEGNIEYKRKLVNPTPERFEHLVTQMKWRLAEGNGEAIYQLGVSDEGALVGLEPKELDMSLATLRRMAKRLAADMNQLNVTLVEGTKRKAVEILIRKRPQTQSVADIRVAVLGNVDAGKSTLIGVLTQGELDNGRGRARLNLFRHLHEIQSGRTSSISTEILGFDATGQPVKLGGTADTSWEEMSELAEKLVVLIDLAGHNKYQRITLYGLTSYIPHCAALVVSANKGMVDTSRDHCLLAKALDVPVFVVITKLDLAPSDYAISQVEEWLKSVGVSELPLKVSSDEDVDMAASTLYSDRLTPIFCVSCVTGQGIDQLTRFLSLLPSSPSSFSAKHRTQLLKEPVELWIDKVFDLPNVEGTILTGILQTGIIHEGDALKLGPLEDGSFLPVLVSSLYRNRVPHRCVQAGQTSSVAVVLDETHEDHEEKVRHLDSYDWTPPEVSNVARRGMVLLGANNAPSSNGRRACVCHRFEAEVNLIGCGSASNFSNWTRGTQVVLHCGNVCQPASIKEIVYKENSTKATVVFEFLKYAEYLKEGRTLLISTNAARARGEVTRICPLHSGKSPLSPNLLNGSADAPSHVLQSNQRLENQTSAPISSNIQYKRGGLVTLN